MKRIKELKSAFAIYKIQDCIGEGGSGLVYKAIDDTGQAMAVKILDSKKASREKLKRFENEYRFCAKNKHQNIIVVLDYGLTENGDPFFVMPLYDHSLRELIGRVDTNTAYVIFKKLLDGVEAAHQLNVIHRDLKPENILIRKGGKEVVVTDFGIARFEEEELYTAVETKDGSRLANFQYAAPEQRTRGKTVDHRVDIYALGLILNELFTSELAHGINFKTIKAVSSGYAYLDLLVHKMLQQDAVNRYQSVDEIKKELIARGEEDIVRQKVNRLKETVIPTTDVDDPIVADPMRIVDGDWEDNLLTITLNHPVNPDWIWALNHMGGYSSVAGKEPENFQFFDQKAHISAEANQSQAVVDHFRQWLPLAQRVYEEKLRRDKEAAEREEREELRRRIQKEEERANVLQKLKF